MQSRSLSGAVAALLLGLAAGAGSLVLAASSGVVSGRARPAATDTPLPPLPVPTAYVLGGGQVASAPTPPAQIVVTPMAGSSAAAPASSEAAAAVMQRMMSTPSPNATAQPGGGPSAEGRATMEAAQRVGIATPPAPEATRMPSGDAFFLEPKWHVQPMKAPIVWRKYVDPNLGFSFDYPAEWRLEGTNRVEGFDFRKGGMLGASIANFDSSSLQVTPLNKAAEFVKIDVSVSYVGSQLRAGETVQEYVGRVRSPGERVLASEAATLGGVSAVLERIEQANEGGSSPVPATSICAIKDAVLYCASLIQFHPGTPNPGYIEILRQLAARFQMA